LEPNTQTLLLEDLRDVIQRRNNNKKTKENKKKERIFLKIYSRFSPLLPLFGQAFINRTEGYGSYSILPYYVYK
jgi:hypothetical protein